MKNLKEKILYFIWLCLYILCVGLGTLQEVRGVGKAVLVVIAIAFFVPGVLLAVHGLTKQDTKMLRRLRLVCILSLSLTVVLLAANFLSAGASVQVGKVLYELLALVSAPMLCGQYWALSLFLWACLLMSTIPGVILPGKK